ncbi:hypothetical protein B296_00023853 [Ensete ventricosum]|uniref:Uncharacterized protein n=1 Tax=Ensete ventricosum TaxID=4639 RepID=A0A427AGV3_ENSVE|nr:hypothetical protein B296_00023853 [Ensete ventricosum]
MGGSRGDDGAERPTRRDSRLLQALYATRPESNPHRLGPFSPTPPRYAPSTATPSVPHLRSHWSHPPLLHARTPQSASSKGVADDLREDVKGKKGAAVSGAVPYPSLVDASWRVKPGRGLEEHPGFHVDYAEPRTHPPSHN